MTDEKQTNVKWDRVIVIPPLEDKRCNHYFEFVDGECRCRSCRMGLLGVVDLKEGKPV